MNEQQRLYYVQARSDWEVYRLLRNQPQCHRLHYMQMCTEKLAKAYFWKSRNAANLGHAAFVLFVRSQATNQRLAERLGFPPGESFREWIADVLVLAHELERLAPSLAGDGPNPEYPWPRKLPTQAPVEHDFQARGNLQSRHGQCLWRLIDQVLLSFEKWF